MSARTTAPAVCYVVSEYPTVSHSFVLNEVEAVRRAGLEVHTVTVRRTPSGRLLSDADRRAAATSAVILPLTPTKAVRALLLPFLRTPRAFLETLRATLATATPGWRAHLWRVFYFVEGMILWSLCEARGIRSIHAHFANVGADLARVAAGYGNRVDGAGSWTWSFTMHGCTEFYDITHYGLADKVRHADAVRAVSDYTRAQLLRIVEEEHWDKVVVVRCGIDVARFEPSPTAAHDELRILLVGRLVVEKGIPVMVDAAAQLRDRGLRFSVRVIGDGDLRERYERQVAEHGLTEVVRFLGAIGHDEIVGHYQSADVMCLTSLGEGLPVVLMEALACELAVVTPWLSGIPELVEDGVTGRLVPPARPDLLADALEELAREPEVRHKLGAAGRQRVVEQYDAAAGGRRMAELFREVMVGA